MGSELKKIEDLGAVVDALKQGTIEQLVHNIDRQEYGLERDQPREERSCAEDEEMKVRQQLVNLLLAKVLQETKDNWPRQTAIQVDSLKAKQPGRISLPKLEELFWHYQRAMEDNIPVGLHYLSEITGLEMNTVLRQLRRAGVKPFNPSLQKSFKKKTVRLSPAEKQRIKNSRNTFSLRDLHFFLGLPRSAFHLRQLPLPDGREKRYALKNFSYRLASEIYQARDNFTPADIQYGLELDQKTYEKYLFHQREISREIILKLRQIYPELGRKIKHPYLTPEIRQLQSEQTLEATILRAIDSAMKTGARGVDELVRTTGFSYMTIRAYSKKKGISLPLRKYRK